MEQQSQQPFIIPQQVEAQLFPLSQMSQPQQQQQQHFYEEQMNLAQQSALPQSSHFPTFPSFNQFAFSLP